jgi:branched-chain amino acid transport system substrate-binding protein
MMKEVMLPMARSVLARASWRLLHIAAAAMAFLAACAPRATSGPADGLASGPPQQATAATPSDSAAVTIKVGAVVPVTGRYASGGEQVRNGYELAIEDVNAAGGVMVRDLGKKLALELRLLDDESDPTKTVQRMEVLFSGEQVLAYLGGFGSDLHAAAAAVAEKNRTPYVGVAFALHQIHQRGLKYLFSPFPKSPDLARTTFDILDSLSPRPTKVAIFAEKTDWGAEQRDLWKKEAETRGYELVADEEYAPGARDFTPMLLRARGGGAEALLALPNSPDGMAIVKQMKELDLNPKFLLLMRAPDSLAWSQNLGKDGDYVVLTPGWSPDLKFPGVEELRQRHQASYNKSAEATTGAAYAAVQVLANALERAGRLDRDAIRDALAATDIMTVMGPVRFNPDGTGQVQTIANQVQDGRQVLVWPKDQASAPLAYPARPFRER